MWPCHDLRLACPYPNCADLREVPLFKDMENYEIERIVDVLELKQYDVGDEMIKEGDEGWSCFIITEGAAAASKMINGVDTVVKNYSPGGYFGELALLTNQPRAASVRAIEPGPCRCVRLARSAFIRVTGYEMMNMATAKEETRNKYKEYLAQVPIFVELAPYELEKMVDALENCAFNDGDTIIREGEQGDCVYVVVNGGAQASKLINGIDTVVKTYGPGGFFGELALLTNQPRSASVHAVGRLTNCLRLGRERFAQLTGIIDHSMQITLRTVLLSGLLNSDVLVLESAIALGANAGFIDNFGCTPAQHALEHASSSHHVLRQLARHSVDSMFQSRVVPGLAMRRHLERLLVQLGRRHQTEDQLQAYVTELRDQLPVLLDGEPPWVKQAVESTIGNAFGWSKFDSAWLADVDAVADAVYAAVSRVKKLGARENARVTAGSQAYTMTLHAQILLDTMDLDEAFKRRPGLLNQLDSQIDPMQRTPLMIAAESENMRWFTALLSKGCDARKTDHTGQTALHYVVKCGKLALTRQLLDHATEHNYDLVSFVDTESKVHITARMLAEHNLVKAEAEHVACRIASRFHRQAGDTSHAIVAQQQTNITVHRKREEQARKLLKLLSDAGAATPSLRRRRYCLRRLSCVAVSIPALLHTVVGCIALLMVSPSLSEIPFALSHVFSDHAVAYCTAFGVILVLCAWAVFTPFISSASAAGSSALCFACTVAALLAVIAIRALYERTWRTRYLQRLTVPPLYDGFEFSSAILVFLFPVLGMQQAALAFVGAGSTLPWQGSIDVALQGTLFSVDGARMRAAAMCVDLPTCGTLIARGNLSCDFDFCTGCRNAHTCDTRCGFCRPLLPAWFEQMALPSVAVICVVGFGLFATLALSLVAVRRPGFQRVLPPLRADNGFRLPAERLLMPWIIQGSFVPVSYNLLRLLKCSDVPTMLETTDAALQQNVGGGSVASGDATLQPLDSADVSHVLTAMPSQECWSGAHTVAAPAAMVILLMWVVLTSIFARFVCVPRVVYGVPCLQFCEQFDAVSAAIKFAMVIASVFGEGLELVPAAAATAGNAALAAIAAFWLPPFPHLWLSRLMAVVYGAAFWASGTAVASELLCSTATELRRHDAIVHGQRQATGGLADTSEVNDCWYWPQVTVCCGWVALAGVMAQLIASDRGFGRLKKKSLRAMMVMPVRRSDGTVRGSSPYALRDEVTRGLDKEEQTVAHGKMK